MVSREKEREREEGGRKRKTVSRRKGDHENSLKWEIVGRGNTVSALTVVSTSLRYLVVDSIIRRLLVQLENRKMK